CPLLLTSVAKALHHNSVILGIITPLHKQRPHVILRNLFAVDVECLDPYPVRNAVEVGQITAYADVSYEHLVVQFLFVALVAHLNVPPPCVVGSMPLSAAGEGKPPSPGPDLPGAGPSGRPCQPPLEDFDYLVPPDEHRRPIQKPNLVLSVLEVL